MADGPTNAVAADALWMRRALRLAGRGFTPPNPMVGCVLVRDGAVVGEGWHPYAGAPHAEVVALGRAGDRARGATAYVSLEPCAHYGRTPPCADALIGAGIGRVVAACTDPHPLVAGRGIERLRQAGIPVTVGVLEPEARRLNEAFFHFQATGLPFVTLKAAMTLDGKIATRTGESRWVSSDRSRRHVHRMRARSGAVLCGIGTVLADDPLLTSRLRGVPRQPLRVVLDTHLRTPVQSRLAQTAGEVPTLVVHGEAADPAAARALHELGVQTVAIAVAEDGKIDIGRALAELGQRGVMSVLVEGGGEVHAAFVRGQQAHRLVWFIAPKVVGGRDAPGPVGGSGVGAMAEAIALRDLRARRLGPDLVVEAAFVHDS